jgi:hypothetical protein
VQTDRLGLTVPQAVVAWSLAFLIGGAAGLIAMLACHYLLSFGGEDSAQKTRHITGEGNANWWRCHRRLSLIALVVSKWDSGPTR